jgi:hypothetical protein
MVLTGQRWDASLVEGVHYWVNYQADNAKLLHILWNKVVLVHAPTQYPPVERVAIDDEADAPDGKAASRSSLREASWWVSFCTAGIYRMTATVVWISTLDHVMHVEKQDRVLTTEKWPTDADNWKTVVHKDPKCAMAHVK